MNLATLYQAIYHDPAHANYGRGLFRCVDFLPRIQRAGLHSVLSIGCGHGDELAAMSGRVAHVVGLDVALPECVWYDHGDCSLRRLEGDARRFLPRPNYCDAITSFDVLEHINPDDIEALVLACAETAPRAFFAVANMPDLHRLPDGREVDLHLIQQPAEWWADLIRRVTRWPVEIQRLAYPERFGLWCGAWT